MKKILFRRQPVRHGVSLVGPEKRLPVQVFAVQQRQPAPRRPDGPIALV